MSMREMPPLAKSYKVACKTKSDTEWCYNGMRFSTKEEAWEWGNNLYMRWTALDKWEVHPSDDEPNQKEAV